MPIYLATAGEYSDYRVLRAFTTKVAAESYAEKRNTEHTSYGYYVEVAEVPVDDEDLGQDLGPVYELRWSVDPRFYPKDDSETIREQWADEPAPEGGISVEEWETKSGRSFGVVVKSPDRERALKVLSERRAKMLALRQL